MDTEPVRPRAFSGIQPTGTIHLGNYLGALRNWAKLQETTDGVYCLVDLHALSVPREPGEIERATIEGAKDLLSIGIDPEESVLFVQSHVREHNELAWLMQCVAAVGELRRMTQFKDKSESNDFVSSALFTYPALQAADILLYDTEIVPVGDDQRQHIEFTRDLANRFNNRYGDVLVIPEHRIPEAGARVMDLQHPENKMSKSSDSPQGTVLLTDTEAEIAKKFKRAVTDNDGEVRFDPENKPGVSNLLTILGVATDRDPVAVADGYTQYGPLKADASEALIELIRPIQDRRAELDDATTIDFLKLGADKARAIAEPVMDRVRAAVQLLPLG
ncbi:MAG: tryptophan--tRNA ligase [Acidimicrobiales bacterium]